MSRGPLCQFSFDDKAVLSGVDVTIYETERDFDILGITIAKFDLSRFELLADPNKYDGPILKGLKSAGFHRYVYRLRRQQQSTCHEQTRT